MRTMVDVALLGESVSSFVCVSACFSSFPLLPFFFSLARSRRLRSLGGFAMGEK